MNLNRVSRVVLELLRDYMIPSPGRGSLSSFREFTNTIAEALKAVAAWYVTVCLTVQGVPPLATPTETLCQSWSRPLREAGITLA